MSNDKYNQLTIKYLMESKANVRKGKVKKKIRLLIKTLVDSKNVSRSMVINSHTSSLSFRRIQTESKSIAKR